MSLFCMTMNSILISMFRSIIQRAKGLLIIFCFFSSVQAQDLPEIIQRHVIEIGGIDALRTVKTLEMSGSAKVLLFLTMGVHNVIVNEEGIATVVSINGDDKSRTITTSKGSIAIEGGKRHSLDPREAAGLFDETDLAGPFVDSEKKGVTLKLLGVQMLKGIGKTYVIEVQRGSNRPFSRYYIRADNYMLARMETQSFSTDESKWMDEWTEYDDYRTIAGIKLPHRLLTKDGEIVISHYSVNGPIDISIFTP